ncbi:cell wall hydrolase [Clostridium estertheticum]|uniref:cell wall hydrolase n=1 Tax=Clostridium estertheticum TaxID=238834 RepID=UPI001CF2234A|nr:cell wall hydrolase [Clostridium estertheticum]MCB2308197.1 cell wall hydrolase [Clostridium estertheticum]MCB2346224.1 cell wall hydrolase [Clostridium estertheticum]MCB2349584.1 cell wall hydrolase [Clostridium estertheticum]WAG46554.1 cell wall hydrolase [Clostridium estertheticum]
MNKFKNIRTIFLASALTIGFTTITSQNVLATSLTTKTYIVKSGDCLSVIAKKCGQSLNDLRRTNNKWNDTIFPGQIIKVPVTTSSTTSQVKLKAQDKTVAKADKIGIKYTESDLNLLSRLITAEAQGESYSAQVAVGAVVVNRVKSGYFPNSISAVINERTKGGYQFTPVLNGNINRPAQASALKAASEALSGADPTNNALFFYDGSVPKGLTAPQPISIVIGNLTFVYLLK